MEVCVWIVPFTIPRGFESDYFLSSRWASIDDQTKDGNHGTAWVLQLCWMLGLVGIGMGLVLYEPIVGGSGLPQLISELNGSRIPKLLDWKTGALKAIGATCAVGAGMACGPEGPIIHIGGCVGHFWVKAVRKTFGLLLTETDVSRIFPTT